MKQILSPILLTLIVFFIGMAFFKFRSWLLLKNYKFLIKGVVNDIIINNNKLYFIVKWTVPEKLQSKNPGNELDLNIQYYHHFIKNIVKIKSVEKEREFINDFINKHGNRNFYLKARIEKGVIRDVLPLDNPGQSFIFYLLAIMIILFLFFKVYI